MPTPPHRSTAALVVAFVAAVLGPALAEGRLLAPGDGLATYYPLRVLAAAALRAGEGPFWNPYTFGGMPLLAALQAGVFFPGNWGFLVLPAPIALNAAVALAYLVAGLATAGFARAAGLTAAGAFVSAIAFAGGGFMVAHLEHLAMIQAAGLLPALLWAIERHRAAPERLGPALAFGVVLALQILAGHPQMVAFSGLIVVAYAVWRGASAPRTGLYARRLALAAGLGVGLALVQLLPATALIQESQRHAFPYALLVADALPPRQLIALWMPFLFGAPPTAWFPTPPWGAGPWYDELVGYVGLSTLALSLLGAWRARREAMAAFWVTIALVGLALALGDATPLYKLWAQLPVLNTMRVPGRHLLELDFALAMLAGLGVSALERRALSSRATAAGWGLVGLPVVAVAAALAFAGATLATKIQPFVPPGTDMGRALSPANAAVWWPIAIWLIVGAALAVAASGPRRGWALGAIVAIDLGVFATHQGWWALSPMAASLPAYASGTDQPYRTITVPAEAYPYRDVARVEALESPGYGSLRRIRATDGFDAFIKARYAALMGDMTHGGTVREPGFWGPAAHGLDMLATRYVRLDGAIAADAAWRDRLTPPRWVRRADDNGVAVFENTRALPRAWRVTEARVADEGATRAAVTADAGFDPRRVALVEAGPAPRALGPGTVTVTTPTLSRIELATEGAGPGLVVVSESYDAGWMATVEGREAPVRRIDGLLLGVEVPAGAQRVTLRYEPPRWRLGLLGSGLSGLALVGWAWWARRRRPRRLFSR